MSRRILVINGHPEAGPERLAGALARAYVEGAAETGFDVRLMEVGALEFPLLRHVADFLSTPGNTAIGAARQNVLWANHLVFIFPLWLGAAPALLKGFMEQLACGEFLLGQGGRDFPAGKLRGRSARVIVTMGMPPLLYRLLYRAHGVKAFTRSILGIGGIHPINTTLLGGRDLTPPRTANIITRIQSLGRSGA